MTWEGLSPPYRTLVADPPWRYQVTRGLPSGSRDPSHERHTAEDNYSTMSNAEIAAMPVRELADDTACLFLWVTNPRMFGERNGDSLTPKEIMEAWGFQYRTLLTWVKTGAPGMGSYFRGDTEHVLFGVRGGFKIPPAQRRRNVITAARGRHSTKPAAFFDLVEATCPGPYLELFCRQPRFSWDSWGHGYENFAEANV
jgi:N6-adenosine-specific RNA methylase IME4